MVVARGSWLFSTILMGSGLVGVASSVAWAQAKPGAEPPVVLEGPVAGGQATDAPPEEPEAVEPELNAPLHDALRLSSTKVKPERAPKSPPPPVAERPSTDPPEPEARWYGGYWSWDPAREDFIWVSGAWRVPPADSIWVEGRWRRDADGWFRVPGAWSRRQEKRAEAVAANAGNNANADANANAEGGWRVNGPPVNRPAETPGPAPGPNFFYVPGQYVPDGDQRTTWKDGFWAQVQPGWDWVPSRWARQANGWEYRDGYWTRDTGPTRAPSSGRHSVARPGELPPAIVESEPATSNPSDVPGELPDADPLARPGSDSDRDVIAESEKGASPAPVVPAVPPPVVIVGPGGRYIPLDPPVVGYGYRSGMPYRMIRPPSPLYGPAGVVVPDAVPPFVQRLLNRVLP